MQQSRRTRPVLNPVVHEVREVYVDIDAVDLRHLATDTDWVIVRISGLRGPSGRPTSKTIRIHADALAEPPSLPVSDDDPFA